MKNPEKIRLSQQQKEEKDWLKWGPYLSERQWGTVREDYSAGGDAWNYFPHDHARSRTYRWGEDGLFGWSDRQCRLCISLALWNGKDPILKERLFGLNGDEGNHGEDVKEFYFYEAATPSHSYNRSSYIYPHDEFPYADLLATNKERGRDQPEYDLKDTGVLKNGWFEISVEYVKTSENETLIQYTIINQGNKSELHFVPQIWFRNTWSWGRKSEEYSAKPQINYKDCDSIQTLHETLGAFYFSTIAPEKGNWIFTENETNKQKLFSGKNTHPVKDGFHDYLINKKQKAIDTETGTKAGYHTKLSFGENETKILRFKLSNSSEKHSLEKFDQDIAAARSAYKKFYEEIIPLTLDKDHQNIVNQTYAGLLWTKQFYHYVVEEWLEGDPVHSAPPKSRLEGRNSDWQHLHNRDIISMPDKWEYPWYAAWDTAFHCVPLAMIDPEFAKDQLIILTREWYMHPNGQIPAYEWAFGDVNPPVHAWAALKVYETEKKHFGKSDVDFLKKIFQK